MATQKWESVRANFLITKVMDVMNLVRLDIGRSAIFGRMLVGRGPYVVVEELGRRFEGRNGRNCWGWGGNLLGKYGSKVIWSPFQQLFQAEWVFCLKERSLCYSSCSLREKLLVEGLAQSDENVFVNRQFLRGVLSMHPSMSTKFICS
ncbi:hypothetical protein Tco_0642933 [Tanacetum coccineum]